MNALYLKASFILKLMFFVMNSLFDFRDKW